MLAIWMKDVKNLLECVFDSLLQISLKWVVPVAALLKTTPTSTLASCLRWPQTMPTPSNSSPSLHPSSSVVPAMIHPTPLPSAWGPPPYTLIKEGEMALPLLFRLLITLLVCSVQARIVMLDWGRSLWHPRPSRGTRRTCMEPEVLMEEGEGRGLQVSSRLVVALGDTFSGRLMM